jgi:hypothetical protein
VIAALLLIAAVSADIAEEIGFRFRGTPGGSSAEGIAVELTIGGEAARADVLVDDGASAPRWKWHDGGPVDRGRVTLRAPAESRALLVVRRLRGARYDLEGPFRWPASPAFRSVRPVPRRTLRGTGSIPSGVELHLVGKASGDALCESDLPDGWQCAAVPRDFTGRLVACDGADPVGAAEVPHGSPDQIVMHALRTSALIRVTTSDPAGDRPPASVRLLRPVSPTGVVLARDSTAEITELDEGLFWLESRGDPEGLAVEVSSRGFATARFAFSRLRTPCENPESVDLVRATRLTGTVSDGSGGPVAGAIVLVRSADSDREPSVIADALTDENGGFEVPDLAPQPHRIRACHAELGCGEAIVVPGEPARIAVSGGAALIGRVLTSAGVPEPSAHVRIVPSLETSARPGDRLARLPLETTTGNDGRFRIAFPDTGEFLLEIRTESSGVARLPVRRTSLSPPITDVGDVRLPESLDFAVRVALCGAGAVSMSGPLGGETSFPALLRFPLDAEGAAAVRLPEGGAWTAWATCGGRNVMLAPALLPDVGLFAGSEVRFEPIGALGDQSAGRSK